MAMLGVDKDDEFSLRFALRWSLMIFEIMSGSWQRYRAKYRYGLARLIKL